MPAPRLFGASATPETWPGMVWRTGSFMVKATSSDTKMPGNPTIRNTSCHPRMMPNGTWIGFMWRKAVSTKALIRAVSAGPATEPICRMAMARGMRSRGNRSEVIE